MSGIFACVCCDFVVEDASDGRRGGDDEGSMQAVCLNRHNYHIRCTVEHALCKQKMLDTQHILTVLRALKNMQIDEQG